MSKLKGQKNGYNDVFYSEPKCLKPMNLTQKSARNFILRKV